MQQSIESRLRRLEAIHGGGVGLIAFNGESWTATFNGQCRAFKTMEEAQSFLAASAADPIIIDDI